MASTLSSLGFPIEMDESYQERLIDTALSGEQLRSRDGRYVRWSPGAGIELWLQVQHREVVGMAPHFAGPATMRIGITERVSRPDGSPMDGAFRAWANPRGDIPDEGEYPFVFDAPDTRRFTTLAIPGVTTVQLAAFAHELQCFSDEAAYDAAQSDKEVKYAAESFIPSGIFVEEGEPPAAFAIFSGRIVRAARRVNPYSGGGFWWLQVATLGGQVDIVADPALVESEPCEGGIAQGSFWLSGRLPSELADSEGPFWRRWLPE